jgi:hypothetical protein
MLWFLNSEHTGGVSGPTGERVNFKSELITKQLLFHMHVKWKMQVLSGVVEDSGVLAYDATL